MLASCILWWGALWVIVYFQEVLGVDGDACSTCYFSGVKLLDIFAWAESTASTDGSGNPLAYDTTTTLTKTIVTVINTALDTTRTTTLDNYEDGRAYPTNDDGTRIETITYSRLGETHTTIMTFPHPFIVWADAYTWHGYGCEAATDGLVTIQSNPQEDISWLLPHKTGSYNAKGSGYNLIRGFWVDEFYNEYSYLFPDQSIIQTCTADGPGGGPAFGGYTMTEWINETSVSTEDSLASTTTSSDATLTTASEDTSITTSDSAISATEATSVQSTSVDPSSSDAADVTAKLFVRTMFIVNLSLFTLLVML